MEQPAKGAELLNDGFKQKKKNANFLTEERALRMLDFPGGI